MKKLTHQEILARQHQKLQEARLPFCVVLNDIRSLFNVGSIFRTADGAGIEKLWLCGITGYPPQSEISKTALGAEARVAWEHVRDVKKVITNLKQKHYQIVLLEQMTQSIPYQKFHPQSPVCLVVGNEIGGISDEIVDLCDAAVDIEMTGIKNSLNASVAFGIVVYHFRHCLL